MHFPQLSILDAKFQQPCASEEQPSVGQRLTDEEREEAIKRASDAMDKHWGEWERTGCFAALGAAHQARDLMYRLMVGRYPRAASA